MATLTTKHRNALPSSDFAGPGRSYPVPDKAHAADAKARAAQFASPAERARIDAKADKVLHAEHGSTDVPGRPQPKARDTVPAMLSPGEAVLNRGAAAAIGRPKIAAANRAHLADNKPPYHPHAAAHKPSHALPSMHDHADQIHPVGRRR